MPTKTLNIHQRILAITNEAEAVKKEAKKKGMLYNYVSHDAVTNHLRPLMIKHGVSHEPSVAEWRHDGNRCEMKVAVTFVNSDDPTDRFTVCGVGYGIDSQDKGPGKAESYAVKTVMLKQFQLETGEPDIDSDQKTEHQPDRAKITKTPASSNGNFINESKVILFLKEMDKLGKTEAEVSKWLKECNGIDGIHKIPNSRYSELKDGLSAMDVSF